MYGRAAADGRPDGGFGRGGRGSSRGGLSGGGGVGVGGLAFFRRSDSFTLSGIVAPESRHTTTPMVVVVALM